MEHPMRSFSGAILLISGTIAFSALHLLWYTRVVAWWLWELSGGITEDGQLTAFGATDWAWTVPLHLPAGLFFRAGSCLALPFLLGGTLTAGFVPASIATAILERGRPVLGRRWWRFWLLLAGWGWAPVPSTMSWIYQWTVVY